MSPLARLYAEQADLTQRERRLMEAYLIGWLSSTVSGEEWGRAIAAARSAVAPKASS